MPFIMHYKGYRVYFWSNENQPIEPVHVHVSKSPHQNAPKFWVLRDGSVSYAGGNTEEIPQSDIRRLEKTLTVYSADIIKKWEEFFNVDAEYIDDLEHEEP